MTCEYCQILGPDLRRNTSIYICSYIYIYSELLLYILGATSVYIFVSIFDIFSITFIIRLYIQEFPEEKFHNFANSIINRKIM